MYQLCVGDWPYYSQQRLSQSQSRLQPFLGGFFSPFDGGELIVKNGDDAFLLGEGREGNREVYKKLFWYSLLPDRALKVSSRLFQHIGLAKKPVYPVRSNGFSGPNHVKLCRSEPESISQIVSYRVLAILHTGSDFSEKYIAFLKVGYPLETPANGLISGQATVPVS